MPVGHECPEGCTIAETFIVGFVETRLKRLGHCSTGRRHGLRTHLTKIRTRKMSLGAAAVGLPSVQPLKPSKVSDVTNEESRCWTYLKGLNGGALSHTKMQEQKWQVPPPEEVA